MDRNGRDGNYRMSAVTREVGCLQDSIPMNGWAGNISVPNDRWQTERVPIGGFKGRPQQRDDAKARGLGDSSDSYARRALRKSL